MLPVFEVCAVYPLSIIFVDIFNGIAAKLSTFIRLADFGFTAPAVNTFLLLIVGAGGEAGGTRLDVDGNDAFDLWFCMEVCLVRSGKSSLFRKTSLSHNNFLFEISVLFLDILVTVIFPHVPGLGSQLIFIDLIIYFYPFLIIF